MTPAATAPERARSPRHAEMLTAAARLFSQRGYHGTSMQDLADALGLQRGSLYAHIEGKEELLFDVVMEGAHRFLERGRAASALTASAGERLTAFLTSHVETVAGHLAASTVFLTEWTYLSDVLRVEVATARDSYEAIVRSIIEDGIQQGEFRPDLDVRAAAILVLSAGNWMYAWYRPGGELTPTDIGHRFADLVVMGFRRESG